MLQLQRHHDFQLFLSPQNNQLALTNPPSFNWPQPKSESLYRLELQLCNTDEKWSWDEVRSPLQLSFTLANGEYRWRLMDKEGECSEWFTFTIDLSVADYVAPTAKALFDFCQDRQQFMMYLDDDIEVIKAASNNIYPTLKATAMLAVKPEDIHYPMHYKRGTEAGKRTAIVNVREWLDRDLMTLALLYKIWQEQECGDRAVELLLTFAQWSPEGPATLVRPLTWGDEVGLSLARNLFLAYHWLSPLMSDPEKGFIRPMLIRIAYQMEERLQGDEFHQFPGHSHTSRLPGYLGVAALVLHKEFDQSVCERWLNYALMVYRGVLPFYGGSDGSWAEGPFYSSSYSKWHHPFFLSVERLSDFSFYEHPFYKNYCHFAMDFVATEQSIHPFGDGFWCKRESVEWPGFFAQNPLRIYAQRFGDQQAIETSEKLESQIKCYALHLLDVVPTVKQLAFINSESVDVKQESTAVGKFYGHAGFGIAKFGQTHLSFRASPFGNSSHRHADQGNFALMDNGLGVLTPTGSYGYCFGSTHHSEWTQTTQAHNLPLIGGIGQLLDDESATAKLLEQSEGEGWYCSKVDLSRCYPNVVSFIRTFVLLEGNGVVIWDSVTLPEPNSLQWRLHSHLQASSVDNSVQLTSELLEGTYQCLMETEQDTAATLAFGYRESIPVSGGIESDATSDIYHIEWDIPSAIKHDVVVSCLKVPIELFSDSKALTIALKNSLLVIDKLNTMVKDD
jgi:hypothetical protein